MLMRSSSFTNGSDIETALRGEIEKTLRVELEKAVHAELEKTLRAELGKALTAQRDKILHAEREKLARVEKEKAQGLERERALELEREKAREAEVRAKAREDARVAAGPAEVTAKWFLGNAPAALWLGLLALMIGVFVAGAFVGRTRFAKQLLVDIDPSQGRSVVVNSSSGPNE